MSLITRCPACGTMFKVVPDQLRISEGWVRCGKCSEVFDAARNLQVLAVPPRPQASGYEPPKMPQETKPAEPSVARVAQEAGQAPKKTQEPVSPRGPAEGDRSSINQAGGLEPEPDPFPPNPDRPVTASSLLTRREHRTTPPPPEDVDALNSIFFPEPSTAQSFVPHSPTGAARSQESVLDEDVSFVREARRKACWRRPLVRLVLSIVAILLVGGLVLQVGLQGRDRLASLYPGLKPWAVQVCEVLRCKLEVPRQIESIVIDNSSFTRVRGDLFRLGFVVRNTSGVEIAAPAVELTLTDMQEKPVIRRVLQPEELGAAPVLAPRGEWGASLNLSVASGGDNIRVAGYRLLAFYP